MNPEEKWEKEEIEEKLRRKKGRRIKTKST
jgi:hypothetical protein